MTSRRIVSLLIAALFVLSGCTITLPFQSNPSESAPASTTTYATVEQALHVLVEHQVNKPSSKTLLDGAVSDVAAYLQAQNLTVPGDTPAFTGNTDDDLRAFAAYLDKAQQQSPVEWQRAIELPRNEAACFLAIQESGQPTKC